MNDDQLLRYSRHLMLPFIDVAGQQRLLGSSVLVVGLGGLGSPASLYLAASGVGRLWLMDDDAVELSNLQRQIAHRTADIGANKAASAAQAVAELNPDVETQVFCERLAADELDAVVAGADLIVDATDNFSTRFALNRAALRARVPLVSGAAIAYEAQLCVFDPRREASPCYACLYPEAPAEAARCAETGVLAPMVGVIGSLQATEAVKVLCGVGEPLVGRLLILDAAQMRWRELALRRDPSCPACGTPD